jgi:hypothetical protein
MTAELSVESQFERKLCEQAGRTLVESRCKQCGEIILGSAIFDDLRGQERQHAARCHTGTQGKI